MHTSAAPHIHHPFPRSVLLSSSPVPGWLLGPLRSEGQPTTAILQGQNTGKGSAGQRVHIPSPPRSTQLGQPGMGATTQGRMTWTLAIFTCTSSEDLPGQAYHVELGGTTGGIMLVLLPSTPGSQAKPISSCSWRSQAHLTRNHWGGKPERSDTQLPHFQVMDSGICWEPQETQA